LVERLAGGSQRYEICNETAVIKLEGLGKSRFINFNFNEISRFQSQSGAFLIEEV
jgi:hypothetical protein